MNELIKESNAEADLIRSFLNCLIKSELHWEPVIQESLDTNMINHSLLDGYEFLFNFKNQFALVKNRETKNWFLREDYQLQLMRFSKSFSQDTTSARRVIHIVRLHVEAAVIEIIVITPLIKIISRHQPLIAS